MPEPAANHPPVEGERSHRFGNLTRRTGGGILAVSLLALGVDLSVRGGHTHATEWPFYATAFYNGAGFHRGEDGSGPKRERDDAFDVGYALFLVACVVGCACSLIAGIVVAVEGSPIVACALFAAAALLPLHLMATLILPRRYRPPGASMWANATGFDI